MAGSGEHAGNDTPDGAHKARDGEATPQQRTETRGHSRGRSRVRRNAGEVIVHERVIQEGAGHGGTIVYPTLTPTNYIEWALVMQINLCAQGLWEAMLGEGMVTDREDMAALAARASAAIAAKSPEQRGGKKNLRVVPVREEVEDCEDVMFNEKLNERTLGEFAVSVSPAKKSNGKLAARSRRRLKRALSIIQEAAD